MKLVLLQSLYYCGQESSTRCSCEFVFGCIVFVFVSKMNKSLMAFGTLEGE